MEHLKLRLSIGSVDMNINLPMNVSVSEHNLTLSNNKTACLG
jgi:hypothetical protein